MVLEIQFSQLQRQVILRILVYYQVDKLL